MAKPGVKSLMRPAGDHLRRLHISEIQDNTGALTSIYSMDGRQNGFAGGDVGFQPERFKKFAQPDAGRPAHEAHHGCISRIGMIIGMIMLAINRAECFISPEFAA